MIDLCRLQILDNSKFLINFPSIINILTLIFQFKILILAHSYLYKAIHSKQKLNNSPTINKNPRNTKNIASQLQTIYKQTTHQQLPQRMQRTQQDWQKLQQQVQRLRKQNQQLKRLLQIQAHNQPIIIPSRREFLSINEPMEKPNCEQSVGRTSIQLKKQWAEWSNRLQASIVSKHNKIRHQTQMEDLRKTTNLSGGSFGGNDGFFVRKSLQSVKSGASQQVIINLQLKSPGKSQPLIPPQEDLSLIQDIFLFGPSISDIQSASQRKFIANHQLYYPQSQKSDFQSYGYYLFPNQLQVKHIREKNHATELNKIIFKNNKKLDCNVFIFWRQESNLKLNTPNKILDRVNPSKWLYGLSIQFSDFVSACNENITSSKINKTLSLTSQLSQKNQRYIQVQLPLKPPKQKQFTASSKKHIQTSQQIFRSNFCLCIMTYFPFIRFLKDILIQVFDSVKLKRMNRYSNCSSFNQIDIFYFIQQLKLELNKFLDQKLKIVPEIDRLYEFPINEVMMRLDLKENNLVNQVVADWGFKILKMLDKDSLGDIFCYMVMEETLIFVAEDRNILTFVILLYVVVLSLPFGYPHPSISVVFNQTLLQTPFTGILGVNKPTKWLQQNLEWLTQNKQNKIVVNLNQQEIKIKCKKRPRTHKSQKLKKIFTSFYKKLQTSAIPSIFKKKMQLISRQTTKQQNQHVSHMLNQLHTYYQQQLLTHLPNKQIIELIRESYLNGFTEEQREKNPNAVGEMLVEKIEKYMAESRKTKVKEKEGFVEELVKKQLFRLYIDKVYDIR